jgi:hypothetical protein
MPTSFGQDAQCRVYVSSLGGPVYRLEALAPAGTPACQSAASAASPGATAPRLPGPASTAARDRTPPRLTRVGLTHRRFRVARASTPRLAQVPLGTYIAYALSERAQVYARFYKRYLRRPHYRLAGTLVRRGARAGRNVIPFTGRVGSRALPVGAYRVSLRARDAAGNVSPGRLLGLTIVG